jgi:limonene-1,2-epoxide hydrolase
MSANSEMISNFVNAWTTMDLETIMGHFTEDAIYTNIPMGPPNEGAPAIRAFIEGFIGSCQSIEFIVHHQIDTGDMVMNERTDKIDMGGNIIELAVMGVFEIRDGKIAAWRDYFDMAAFSAAG